ncbi:unnamed protein product [Fraxinus pennsylvanica]|uniref:FHA domain-containing protein n=1 Tax=Fraxinus pennsylvanica TaxID=56036 RepID=A0AAD1Z8Y9_9LAMI|nr:unnamed protein product [Fraxinus pennsylvanica]
MAPATASTAASWSEEQGPTLKLIVEKGPLSGQAFDFRSGSRIQIGRVVRGNSITIKDAGISSKHVVIQFAPNSHPDPGPKSCQWTITDLESSNGTILNDAQLEPAEPCVLSDGDVVKIGEMTSIRVKFEETGREGGGNVGKTRRNPRRGAAAQGQKVVELAVIDEDSELGIDDRLGDRNNLRGRDRSGKDVVSLVPAVSLCCSVLIAIVVSTCKLECADGGGNPGLNSPKPILISIGKFEKKDDVDIEVEEKKESESRGAFKLNAVAPEFVP